MAGEATSEGDRQTEAGEDTDSDAATPTPASAHADEDADTTPPYATESESDHDEHLEDLARDAFEAAIDYCHEQLDREVDFPHDGVGTPREYFREVRGWDDETIDDRRLGWAPANRMSLLDHLMGEGYGRPAILGTGLFWTDGLDPIWQGRLVLPYLDDEGSPVFAISRRVGDDGHPDDDAGVYAADDAPAKYHKIPDQDETVVEEPIYGTDTLDAGDDLLITEGIADAITAHQAGYSVLSPVTTSFKHEDRERLVALLEDRDVGTVYVVQDAENPTSDLTEDADGWEALTVEQFGEGVKGAARTAGYLADNGVDARIGELPQPSSAKVDLDDFLRTWHDSLAPVFASAKPATQHPAYDAQGDAIDRAQAEADAAAKRHGGSKSALFDLDLVDVAPVSRDYRGVNPLGHHGDSENYYLVLNGGEVGFDHKHKAAYNALTHLLVEVGERRAASPSGPIGGGELLAVWVYAKKQRHVVDDDPIPHQALQHVAVSHGLCDREDLRDGWRIPREAYNDALQLVRNEYGVEPGREPVRGTEAPERDPLDPEVVHDYGAAYRAAEAVTPAMLEAEGEELPVVTTDDGDAWLVDGTRVSLIRAVAVAEDLITTDSTTTATATTTIDDETFLRAYAIARERYGAPLPEYVDASTATQNYELVRGAVRELRGQHILGRMDSDVTVGQPSSPDAVAILDPSWENSESGERIVLFASGLFYCRKHETAFGPLTAVALEQGYIADEDATLQGDAFRAAYNDARELYGAPLPEWLVGEVHHTPVLPEPDAVIDEFVADEQRLANARERVSDLFADLAGRDPDAPENARAHVLRALPALGKTTAAVLYAQDEPVTYLGHRKELMQDVMQKATGDADLDVDLRAEYIPVFAETKPTDQAVAEAVEIVRDEGRGVLRNFRELADRVDAAIHPENREDDDAEDDQFDDPLGLPEPGVDPEDDEVHLDRASCAVGSGVSARDDEEMLAWWLAVHVAGELGHTPREIHVDAEGLFGEELPCQHDGDCHYSHVWDRISDPGEAFDLLVGHYVHGYVAGACTAQRYREDGTVDRQPRAVVVDEFPGRDPYTSAFDEDYREHARWLASALDDDVDDVTDMREADLWDRPFVRRWLRGEVLDESDGDADQPAAVAAAQQAHDHLGVCHRLATAQEAAQELREDYPEAAATLGIDDVLAALTGDHGGADPDDPALPQAAVDGWYNALRKAVDAVEGETAVSGDVHQLVGRLDNDVLPALAVATTECEGDLTDLPADLPDAGELRRVVERAVAAVATGADYAPSLTTAAQEVLAGGEAGTRALARHADDGYAHPEANYLLDGVLAEGGDTMRLELSHFAWGDRREDGTNCKRVDAGQATILLDRNEQGADIHKPPEFQTTAGEPAPVVGLDATARAPLWSLALGGDVDVADIHDTARERRAFLREVMNLQVVQSSAHPHYWEGSPEGKDLDKPAALLQEIADRYAGRTAQKTARRRVVGRESTVETSDLAAVTTKSMKEPLSDLAGDAVDTWEHYGNMIGSNALEDYNLGAVLGCQHYGHAEPEYWAALAGEQTDRTGRGAALDYGSKTGNAFLEHMRRDKTMQALLRFGRSEEGAVVFAYTSALRDDLPVVGEAAVLTSHSQSRQEVAAAAADHRQFTVSDVVDEVECTRRNVQRVLDELAEAGYVRKHETGTGLANTFRLEEDPGPGEAELPSADAAPSAATEVEDETPDESHISRYYTWNVGVGADADTPLRVHGRAPLEESAAESQVGGEPPD